MPELQQIFGMRFFFYSIDHLPPHLHVRNADGEARISIEPVVCIENKGLKNKDLYLAESIIEENKENFLNSWNEYFKLKN